MAKQGVFKFKYMYIETDTNVLNVQHVKETYTKITCIF